MAEKKSFSRTLTIDNTQQQDSITVNLEFEVNCGCPDAGSYVRSDLTDGNTSTSDVHVDLRSDK